MIQQNIVSSTQIDKQQCTHCPNYRINCRYRNNVWEKNCKSFFKIKTTFKDESGNIQKGFQVNVFDNNKEGGNWGFQKTMPAWINFPMYSTAQLLSPQTGPLIRCWLEQYPGVLQLVGGVDGVTELDM